MATVIQVDETIARTSGVSSGDTSLGKELPIKYPCNTCGTETTDECITCENDFPAYEIVSLGGKLHLQFFLTDQWNPDPTAPVDGWKDGWIDVSIVTPSEEITFTEMDDVFDEWMVASVSGRSYQVLIADIDKIAYLLNGEKCFQFKITNCRPSNPEYYTAQRCTSVSEPPAGPWPTGYTYATLTNSKLWEWNGIEWVEIVLEEGEYIFCQSTGIWYEVDSGMKFQSVTNPLNTPDWDSLSCTYCFTRVYRLEQCEHTVCFSADFGETDCLGNLYNIEPDSFVGNSETDPVYYNPSMCVKGKIELEALPREETRTDEGTLQRVKLHERARVRTWGITEEMAKSIRNFISQKVFYINSEVWDSSSDIEKNNENGDSWWLDFTVEREICDQRLFECEQ